MRRSGIRPSQRMLRQRAQDGGADGGGQHVPLPEPDEEAYDLKKTPHKRHDTVMRTLLFTTMVLLAAVLVMMGPFFYTMYRSHQDMGRLVTNMAAMSDSLMERRKDIEDSIDAATSLAITTLRGANHTAIDAAWATMNNLATLLGDPSLSNTFQGAADFFGSQTAELSDAAKSVLEVTRKIASFLDRLRS